MKIDGIKSFFKGDILTGDRIAQEFSRDASLFEIKPEMVVFPKDTEDIKNIVKFVSENKKNDATLSLTPRSGGTDMTGGPLSESIVLVLTKYFNRVFEVGKSLNHAGEEGRASSQPGVFYRNFEKETLKKDFLLPSYPASREICTVGGMVANNSGGEKTLKYGKTEDYVKKLKVVLSDGNEYELGPLGEKELKEKMRFKNFEGGVYSKIYKLIEENYDLIKNAKPNVSKNSAGYNLWDVWDRSRKKFDLTKLFTGSQGTLGIITEIEFKLIKRKANEGLVVVFLKDLNTLPDIITTVLNFHPTSFESFDDHTLNLALKFFPGFLKLLGAKNLFSLAFSFLPEFWMVLTKGVPKLILLVGFEEDSQLEVERKTLEMEKKLKYFGLETRVAKSKGEVAKYWALRRESFNLLRQKVKDKQTEPFIDDIVVRPEFLPTFLPELNKILSKYNLLYTIAGHVGDGNFHIIPLGNLKDEKEREKIPALMDEVYPLVFKYGGSMTGEHNDGLIRGPYLRQMYGDKVYELFNKVKKIFDPLNIFNPGKKVGADLKYSLKHLKTS